MQYRRSRRIPLALAISLLLVLAASPVAGAGLASSPLGAQPFAGLGSCPLGVVHIAPTR